MSRQLSLVLGREQLELLAEKAIYLPAHQALLIADTHFGKVGHFRKAGIAVPDAAAADNFQRLRNLLLQRAAKYVYFMGDLFHSEMNMEWFALRNVMGEFPDIEFILVEGNHDVLLAESYQRSGLELRPQVELGALILSHEPLAQFPSDRWNICGHVHPGVMMSGAARQRLRVPCFYLSNRQLIMPAFGTFTGLYKLKPKKGDQVYISLGDQIRQVL